MKEKVLEVNINELRKYSPKILEDIHKHILTLLQDSILMVDEFFISMLSSCANTLEKQESEYLKILKKQKRN